MNNLLSSPAVETQSVISDAAVQEKPLDGSLHSACSAVLDADYFREIVCYLKHSGMRAHAAKLTRQVNPAFSIREALAWVDQLTHRKPIGFRRLHGFDDPPNTEITQPNEKE